MKAPCLDCENRGCGSYHDKCEKYLKYKDESRELRDTMFNRNEIHAYIHDASINMKKSRRSINKRSTR